MQNMYSEIHTPQFLAPYCVELLFDLYYLIAVVFC